MRAIRVHQFGDPNVMKLEDVPELKPGKGEVVVKIEAVGVNPVETYIRSGSYANLPALPYTPGTDAGGVVEAVGEGVTGFSPGEKVYVYRPLTGTYAEKTLCKETQVYRLPNNVSTKVGAALGVPYGVAYRALFHKAKARAGETVLIHGATGGVGTAALQLARAAGLTVIGTAGSQAGVELILSQGAHFVVNHHDPAHLEVARSSNDNAGIDIIIEMLANVNLGKDLKALNSGGRIVVIGSRGTVEIDPRDAMAREASIFGVLVFSATAAEVAETHAAFRAGLESGTIRPVVGKEFSLEDAPSAHRHIMETKAQGKVILVP
jgi:NADPH2:quinone reductase